MLSINLAVRHIFLILTNQVLIDVFVDETTSITHIRYTYDFCAMILHMTWVQYIFWFYLTITLIRRDYLLPFSVPS